MHSTMQMQSCSVALILAAGLYASAVAAHDEKPEHGGIVQSVKDIAYELAPHEQGLRIYVNDHGNPVPMVGVQGKLVLITSTGNRTERPLTQGGENILVAPGPQLELGQRATAVLKMPSGRSVVVQFPLK